ncbi:MAG: hypothetical protein IJT62_07780 [Oscillospiraceae bacterium]|nr:hypothetical protein [Oscillospiraceae bacterium]
MQKEAWTYGIAATVLGALGMLLRWLQRQIIFEEETGLPIKNAPISVVFVVFLILAAAGLWWLSGRLSWENAPQEPEDALAQPFRVVSVLLAAAGFAAGAGAAYMFLTETSLLLRVAALLGLFCAPVLALTPSLPRWGGFGTLLAVLPVLFFSFWLVLFYRESAVDPIVWEYGVQMLSIAGCLFAAYRLCGYVYYRIKARVAVFACALGMVLCMTVLMDDASLGARALFAGWGVGLGTLCWLLVYNFSAGEKSSDKTNEKSAEKHKN